MSFLISDALVAFPMTLPNCDDALAIMDFSHFYIRRLTSHTERCLLSDACHVYMRPKRETFLQI
jgi:hypothetical protein